MLILVAVTINLSADGGLFAKSRKAARDTEEQSIYDQIVNAMELNENGKIKPRDTFESFKSNFGENKIQEKGGNTGTKIAFTVKGARDTYTYTITENEIIIGQTEGSAPTQKYEIAFKSSIDDIDFTIKRTNFIILKSESEKLIIIEFDGGKILVNDQSENAPYEFNQGKWSSEGEKGVAPQINEQVTFLTYQKAIEIDPNLLEEYEEWDYGIDKELLEKIIILTEVE